MILLLDFENSTWLTVPPVTFETMAVILYGLLSVYKLTDEGDKVTVQLVPEGGGGGGVEVHAEQFVLHVPAGTVYKVQELLTQ